MSKKQRHTEAEDLTWELESKLEPGMFRFLAHVIENGLQLGLRTQQDFIRHFPPRDIMQGLADRPDIRANILVPTTGTRPKIALKKSAESAGEDLQIALDEGETDAELIVSLFHPDDRVRYLDSARLWNYIAEPKFWLTAKNEGAAFDRATSHLAFILDRAIEDRIVSHRDIVDGISVETLVKHLPASEVQSIFEKALTNSHNGKPFSEQDLVTVISTRSMVEHIPHSLLWDQVIYPKLADKADLTGPFNNTAASNPSNNGRYQDADADIATGSGFHHDTSADDSIQITNY